MHNHLAKQSARCVHVVPCTLKQCHHLEDKHSLRKQHLRVGGWEVAITSMPGSLE